MSTLVVGDVHGCSEELRLTLEAVQPRRVILLGDLFTKGPDPQGVWELVVEYGAESVLGNHDCAIMSKDRFKDLDSEALKWLRERPLYISGTVTNDRGSRPWIVVHAGLNPLGATTRAQALVLRRWPDDKDHSNPFWWQIYTGPELVIYGHDAQRLLQDNRPKTLGLDTGCVYGGQLSSYLLEEDQIIQTPALRTYKPIG